ncbi:MFS transporter [Chryseobacterium sp. R2A-55]|uniref:MFS transporter n=1 Tax=Chryseobacterium sp. R2A-55 TaxID=2744445 RepID=UPI001F360679|nr:MFS transporter [Chryseobacterium sp. R2A-55]
MLKNLKKYLPLLPLFLVQFFTWLGLFSLWIYATPVISTYFFVAKTPGIIDYESGTTWVGICFALYSFLGATFTFTLHKILKKNPKYGVHALALLFGGIGMISMEFIHSKWLLLLSFVFIGIAWSSISTTPYLLVGEMAPDEESEKFYSVFNFSTVIPQAFSAFFLAFITKNLFHGAMMKTLFTGGIYMILAAVISLIISIKKKKIG